MDDLITNEILLNDLKKTIYESNNLFAIKGEPKYKLSDILSDMRVKDLKIIADIFMTKEISKLNKSKLVSTIYKDIMEKDHVLEGILLTFSKRQLNTFKKVVAIKQYEVEDELISTNIYAIKSGMMVAYKYEGSFYLVVSDEVKEIYKNFINKGFEADLKHYENLDIYANAATSLYGVLTLDEFIVFYNKYNKKKIKLNDEFKALSILSINSFRYEFRDEYIVESYFMDQNNEFISQVYYEASKHERFYPIKNEVLAYSEEDYYFEFPEFVALNNLLSEFEYLDEDDIDYIIDEVYLNTMLGSKLQIKLDTFSEFEIEFNKNQYERLTHLLMMINNNCRLWIINGNTPNELSKDNLEKLKPLPSAKIVPFIKTGRNDACSCGSGKKYKKCCGKFMP